MKSICTIFFAIFFLSITGYSQPNSDFSDIEEIQCPFNPAVTIQQPKHWHIYQTLNDKWDGTVDSSECVSVLKDPQDRTAIDLATINPNKAIFIRGLQDNVPVTNLISDYIYNAVGEVTPPQGIAYKTSTDCPNGICSGLIVGVEIPDSSFTGTNTRFHYDIPDDPVEYYDFMTCFATEYFDDNRLSEFILKITLDNPPTDLTGQLLVLRYGFVNGWSYPTTVPSPLYAHDFNSADTSYYINLMDALGGGWGYSNFLFQYADHNTYPSSQNIYYTEVGPFPNTATPSKVDVIVDEFNTVIFQPYTALRGTLVEGSDSVRHQVNLISDGSDICMEGIIDFGFDGSSFIYNGGHLNFEGRSACLMFKNKGALVVGKNQTLYYGQNGKGILALQPGGAIVLRENSRLHIDNTLWLQGVKSDKYPQQFYLDLLPGTTLSFGEHAHVLNQFSQDNSTKLNVYMNGGTLDDSNLSAASRSLINRIYPTPHPVFSDNIKLFGNPVSSNLSFGYTTGQDGVLSVEIFDLNGRLVQREAIAVAKGFSKNNLPVGGLTGGVYAVHFKSGQQVAVRKVLVL